MKETDFIEKNKEKWHEFEKLSSNKNEDPDKLSELFVELTEDLSYARTFYPKRSVRVYLNYLSQKVFMTFHKRKKGFLSTFLLFWTEKLPLEMFRGRRQLLSAFLFFAVAILIGVVSSYIDPEFSRVILGDSYVDMTEENINNGDPMAVYKGMEEGSMFLFITINNIKVAFFAFILGIFFSVGTVFILVSNGFMLGAFQYFFYIKGLLLTSFLVIWIHGTLEISAIIVAGAAGIVMGNGLLFPRTLTRTQSLQISAKRGMNMLLGTVPIFIIAGFLESFVTRHTEMPDLVKWVIILASLAFVLFYYVFYPRRVAKAEGVEHKVEEKPTHIPVVPLRKHRIRGMADIFYDSFRFYKVYISKISSVIFAVILPLMLCYLGYLFSVNPYADYELDEVDVASLAFSSRFYFSWIGFFANLLFISLNVSTVIHCMKNIGEKPYSNYLRIWFREIWPYFIKALPLVTILYTLIFYVPIIIPILAIFFTPFITLIFYPSIAGEISFFKGVSKGLSYGGKDWGLSFITFLLMTLLAYFFTWAYHNPLLPELDLKSFVVDKIVEWHTITVFDHFLTIKNFISALFILVIIQFLLPLLFSAFSFQYLNVEDKESAIGLRKRFTSFATGSKHYEKN